MVNPVEPYLCSMKNIVKGKDAINLYSIGLMWDNFKAALHLGKRTKVLK